MPKRNLDPEVYKYKGQLKTFLATTRFNNKTWKENQEYLKRMELPNQIRCIYPCSTAISSDNIPFKANVFILEMNNETNRIMGIGLIKNTTPEYNKYKIYENDVLNTFTYVGGYHIKDFDEEEKKTIKALEQLCFKGKRHQKRLSGIKAFPLDILYDETKKENGKDYVTEIADMFKKRFLQK